MSSGYHWHQVSFFLLIVVMPFPANSPTLSGSLTTLLIAHLATLELGDHLESYVALTGLLRLHARHFFIKLTFLVSTHFSSGQHAHYKYSFISNTGGRSPAGVCHPGRVLAAVVRSAQASPGFRCPGGPHMGRDCCQSKLIVMHPCFQVLHILSCCIQILMCVCIQPQCHHYFQAVCWSRQLTPHWQCLHGGVRPKQPCPFFQAD